MLYRLHHSTTYDYAEPVVMSTHFMHLLPRERPGQRVREADLDDLAAARDAAQRDGLFRQPDHHGFADHAAPAVFRQPQRHGRGRAPAAPAARGHAWLGGDLPAVAISGPADRGILPEQPPGAALGRDRRLCGGQLPAGPLVLAGLIDLNRRIWDDFAYRPGVTSVVTTATQVLQARAGVCQDFAHLMIAALRTLACRPAISRAIRAPSPGGEVRRRGADQSHAWVSAWLGPEFGWVDLDPTNNLLVGEEHVTLAWGRDFQDISPLRGVILGGGRHTLHVGVDLDPILT